MTFHQSQGRRESLRVSIHRNKHKRKVSSNLGLHRRISKEGRRGCAFPIVSKCSGRALVGSYIREESYRDVYPLIKVAIRIFIRSRGASMPGLPQFQAVKRRDANFVFIVPRGLYFVFDPFSPETKRCAF